MKDKPKHKAVIQVWAKLLLWYNLALLIIGAWLVSCIYTPLSLRGVNNLQILLGCIEIGILANVCFSIAPVGEMLTVIIIKREWKSWIRYTVFGTGLLFSAAVFVVFVFSAAWTLSASFH